VFIRVHLWCFAFYESLVFFDALQGVIDHAAGCHKHFAPSGSTVFDEFWWK